MPVTVLKVERASVAIINLFTKLLLARAYPKLLPLLNAVPVPVNVKVVDDTENVSVLYSILSMAVEPPSPGKNMVGKKGTYPMLPTSIER